MSLFRSRFASPAIAVAFRDGETMGNKSRCALRRPVLAGKLPANATAARGIECRDIRTSIRKEGI